MSGTPPRSLGLRRIPGDFHSALAPAVRPPNVLFLTKSRLPTELVLIDFGLSVEIPPDGLVKESDIGAPFYTAPEVNDPRSRGYGPEADMYSLGCVAAFVLTGHRPEGADPLAGFGLSAEAADFVARLRERDPGTRMGAEEALGHPWIAKHVDRETVRYLRGINDEVLAGKTVGPRTASFEKPRTAGKAVKPEEKPAEKKGLKGLKKFFKMVFGGKE